MTVGAPKASSSSPSRPARVLSGGMAEPLYPSTRLLKGSVLDGERAVSDAAQILHQAQAQASDIVAAARAEAQSIKDEAFRQGTRQGMDGLAAVLGNVTAEVERLRARIAVEVEAVALVFAEHLLKAELSFHPERITDLVCAVFKSTRLYGDIVVHLHPDDLALVRPHEEQLIRQLPFAGTVQFRQDHEVALHGVRIETEMGTYDGSIEIQFQRLRESLAQSDQVNRGAP